MQSKQFDQNCYQNLTAMHILESESSSPVKMGMKPSESPSALSASNLPDNKQNILITI